ncbi:MAG: DUF59 domain-containing protein [Candidatus Helarchaeota archaeon]|nr:DUF59 domain-containing protein [Candidatus Helarchaeota archaeon]
MITKEQVIETLKNCYDPEIPIVNLVELGLIYDVQVNENNDINVKMTLTAPGCPMHSLISQDAKSKIEKIEGVGKVNIEVVWDPPWNPNMMSDEAKQKLGLF